MLGKIVVNAERVPLTIAEELANRAARVRSDILHRSGIRRGSGNHNGVFHCAMLFEGSDNLRNRGTLLSNGYIDADNILASLVDDRVKRHGGFAGLAIANDQFALTAANWYHRINCFDTGLERLLHGLPVHNARSNTLNSNGLGR